MRPDRRAATCVSIGRAKLVLSRDQRAESNAICGFQGTRLLKVDSTLRVLNAAHGVCLLLWEGELLTHHTVTNAPMNARKGPCPPRPPREVVSGRSRTPRFCRLCHALSAKIRSLVAVDKPMCGTSLTLWEGRGLGFSFHALRRLRAVPPAGGCVGQSSFCRRVPWSLRNAPSTQIPV